MVGVVVGMCGSVVVVIGLFLAVFGIVYRLCGVVIGFGERSRRCKEAIARGNRAPDEWGTGIGNREPDA